MVQPLEPSVLACVIATILTAVTFAYLVFKKLPIPSEKLFSPEKMQERRDRQLAEQQEDQARRARWQEEEDRKFKVEGVYYQVDRSWELCRSCDKWVVVKTAGKEFRYGICPVIALLDLWSGRNTPHNRYTGTPITECSEYREKKRDEHDETKTTGGNGIDAADLA